MQVAERADHDGSVAERVVYLPHPSPRGGTFSGWVKDAAQVLAPYAPGAT